LNFITLTLLTSQNLKRVITSKDFFSNHILIIALFVLLTGLFTYPSYLEFDKVIGADYNGDPEVPLNVFWWYNYNIKNPTEPFDFHWLFYHDRQYYPLGTPITGAANFNTFLSILIMPFTENYIHTYNIIMYFSFIFTGYGMFHLTKHLTKNYFASIVAGIIFTFGIYHIFHAEFHLSLMALQFIPLSVLFFIRTVESKKIKDPIIGGIFLCLALLSSIYIGFFTVLFFIPLIIYYIVTKRNLQTIIRIGFLLLIAASLAAPYYYGQYMVNEGNESVGQKMSAFKSLSTDIANFVLPPPTQSLTKIIDYPFETSFGITGGGWTFLGYTAIFLAVIAVLRIDNKEKLVWIISGGFLALISLGPFLKIYGIETEIHLPYYYLYDLPYLDVFRAIGRAAIFTTFCVAILAAYGINEIFKINSISNRKKLSIVAVIGVLVIIESITIPFPTFELPDSQIYHEIASDPREIVVLQAPIGLGDSPIYSTHLRNDYHYAQTIFDKQIYSGRQARVPEETKTYVWTNFLNQFIGDQPATDIVKQDLKKVGVSLFDYFDVGYVLIYTDVSRNFVFMYTDVSRNVLKYENPYVKTTWIPQTKSTLIDILAKPPDFEDDRLFAYKIPEPSSDSPFIVLGDGWGILKNGIRKIIDEAEIKIINPTNEITEVSLEIHFISFGENEITLHFNGKEISNDFIDAKSRYKIVTPPLKLNPNENQLTLSFSPMSQLVESAGAVSLDDDIPLSKKAEVMKIAIDTESEQFMIEKLG